MILYNNDFFTLIGKGSDVFIKVKQIGFDLRNFNEVLEKNPRVILTSFLALKSALLHAQNDEIKIGEFKPDTEVIISKDEMTCSVKINHPPDYIAENRKDITTNIIVELSRKGINEGIMADAFNADIQSYKAFIVAKGTFPVNGEDAKVKYYELVEPKPKIGKDGTVDYYNMNLIDVVNKGDWLGEKIPPTEGKDGITVTGKRLIPKRGKNKILKYDRKTVGEYKEGGKIILRALLDGAVAFKGGKICVDNHLTIHGDVDYSIGNIDFDGFVTVKGTVKDGFSITAKYDISILSEMGIGAVDKILSTKGSIFIKGGVNGKLSAVIQAQKDVYVKYCNETTITAGGKIDIGYYSIDSDLKADKIIMNPKIGKLIGGNVCADSQIVTGTIGNKFERKTNVSVSGFNRMEVKGEFEEILKRYKKLVIKAEDLKSELDIYDLNFSINDNNSLLKDYNRHVEKYEKLVEELAQLDERRVKLQEMLQSRGEGQVSVAEGAYPKTFLELKKVRKKIDSLVKGTFYINGRELFFDQDL